MKILNLSKLSVLILELKKGHSCSLKSKYFLSELKFFFHTKSFNIMYCSRLKPYILCDLLKKNVIPKLFFSC